MKRDGAQTSLWQDKMQDYTTKTQHIPNQIFDVIIAGGGVTGIATALQLQKAGKRCLIAEAHNICFGTTGGTTAHLNTVMDNPYNQVQKDFGESGAQLLAQASRQALDLVKKHVTEYNIDCGYGEKDGYLFSQTEEQTKELQDIFIASKQAG